MSPRWLVLLFVAGCFPERVRYADTALAPAAALDRVDAELSARSLSRREYDGESAIGRPDEYTDLNGGASPRVYTTWTTVARLAAVSHGTGTRLVLYEHERRRLPLFEAERWIEIESFGEWGFARSWSLEPQFAVGAASLRNDVGLRAEAGLRAGYVLRRSPAFGDGEEPRSAWRLGVGAGAVVLGTAVMFRPAIALAWERQAFVEPRPGEPLPMGLRYYLEAQAAPLVGGDRGIDVSLAAGAGSVGAIVVSGSWLADVGRSASVSYRCGTECSTLTGALALLLLGLVYRGADAIMDTYDGPH